MLELDDRGEGAVSKVLADRCLHPLRVEPCDMIGERLAAFVAQVSPHRRGVRHRPLARRRLHQELRNHARRLPKVIRSTLDGRLAGLSSLEKSGINVLDKLKGLGIGR